MRLMKHVFISYKRNDRSFALEIENRLIDAGLDTWTDNALRAGENWRDGIDEAIHNAFALVVLITPEARKSEYITYEWAFAMGLGIPIVPVVLVQTKLHPKLEPLHYINFTDRGGEPWDELITRLKQMQDETYRPAIVVSRQASAAVKNAATMLDHPDTDQVLNACLSLKNMCSRDENALDVLFQATKHANYDVRVYAVYCLGQLKIKEAVPRLLEMLSEEDHLPLPARVRVANQGISSFREFIVTTIGEIGVTDSITNGLIEHLKTEPWPSVRGNLIRLLDKYGNEQIAGAIAQLMTDEDEESLVSAMVDLLEKHAGETTIQPILAAIPKLRSTNNRRGLLKVVGQRASDQQTVESLISWLPIADDFFSQIPYSDVSRVFSGRFDEGIYFLWSIIREISDAHNLSIIDSVVDAAREHIAIRNYFKIRDYVEQNAEPAVIEELYGSDTDEELYDPHPDE